MVSDFMVSFFLARWGNN